TSRSRKARSKRALWATSTASPAKARKRRTASCAGGAPRSCAGPIPVSACTAAGSGTRGSTSVAYASAGSSRRTRCAPSSQIRHVAGERPVVSRSNTTHSASSIGVSSPPAAASPTASPRQASRASPATTSSRSERASAAGALASANSVRAASAAETAPPRAVTRSTRRSAASNESCTPRKPNRTCVRTRVAAVTRRRRGRAAAPSLSSEEWGRGAASRASPVSVQRRLQLAAGRELRHGGGADRHLLAGARVDAHALGAPRGGELAEAGEADRVAGLERAGDGLEHRVDRGGGLLLRERRL